ncbi:MAG: ABC transporter permease [Bacteroidetes bacterium]|nr:ABC transporter permease [Bacteroidota bacterium]
MKIISIIIKGIKEQLRHFWILILTVSMAPFFVFIYYLLNETTKPNFKVLVMNADKGTATSPFLNYGDSLKTFLVSSIKSSSHIPVTVTIINDSSGSIRKLQQKEAEILVYIPEDFSCKLLAFREDHKQPPPTFVIEGDLTNYGYLLAGIWAGEEINKFLLKTTSSARLYQLIEIPLGSSASIKDFDIYVPGLLILSLIMLMFTATIAMVAEVENKTVLRLKLSQLKTLEWLAGVSVVQILVGMLAIFLTLLVAGLLGFQFHGSYGILLIITILTSLSIISFSMIIAALTKTVTEVLIIGNFPMFLFMFFTGAAFPIKSATLFSIFGYHVTWQTFMSPTPAIEALKKVTILGYGWREIMPEMMALVILTILYFIIGTLAFRKRHMRVL